MRITYAQVMLYPFTDSSHMFLLVHHQRKYSFTPPLPEQLSSAIKPGPATLVNGTQRALGDKVELRLMVGSVVAVSCYLKNRKT